MEGIVWESVWVAVGFVVFVALVWKRIGNVLNTMLGQSTDKGIIFVSESNFESEAGSEWVIGTCVKSPCVAAGNNELVSAYR